MPAGPFPEKIVSGGQTGVDRAALETALALGIPCGGWCPKGRKAEDGAIPEHYPVTETESATYEERTRLNVCESDATMQECPQVDEGGDEDQHRQDAQAAAEGANQDKEETGRVGCQRQDPQQRPPPE